MLFLFAGSLLLVLVFSGCAPAKVSAGELLRVKTLQPPEGKALVYIIRTSALGGAIRFNVTCDDRFIGSTFGSQFIYTFVDPGAHQFVSMAEDKARLALSAEAGKTYFIRQKAQMGIVAARNDLELVEESAGREALKNLKLAADCKAYGAAVPVAR
jgi:hypothetical protein